MGLVGMGSAVTVEEEEEDKEDKLTVGWWIWAPWVNGSFILFGWRKKKATEKGERKYNIILLTTATFKYESSLKVRYTATAGDKKVYKIVKFN